jgi:cytosine/adenosine deaminase-related metal-dependent hydrolase
VIDGLYSLETTSKELWESVTTKKESKPLVLYGAYSNFEKQISWTRYGKSPIAQIKENDGLSERTVLLQSLFTDFFDRERIRTAKASVSLCPSDALHDGIQLPLVTFLKQDINTSIGTGYCGSSMLEEMKLASYGAKLETSVASQFQASDAFYAATVAGSRAIGDPMGGRIDIGYYADLMIVDHQRFTPSNYPLVSLVYYGETRDIDKVIVGGKIVFDSERDKKQMHELGKRVQIIAEKVWAVSRGSIL